MVENKAFKKIQDINIDIISSLEKDNNILRKKNESLEKIIEIKQKYITSFKLLDDFQKRGCENYIRHLEEKIISIKNLIQ